jgi:arylsulfatase A-like enzyme
MKVVVLTARGLQARALGPYGNAWVSTPALDRLAAGGVVFDWHLADRADAAGAARAWCTGRYDLPVPGEPPAALPPAAWLATLRSAGITADLIVDESRGEMPLFAEDREWDQVWHIEPDGEGSPLERCLDAAGAALESLADRDDWLLWIDLATVLPPWETPDDFLAPYFEEAAAEEDEDEDEHEEEEEETEDEEEMEEPLTPLAEFPPGPIDPTDDHLFLSLQSSYAAAVSYLDAGLGQLLEAIEESEGGSEVAILFTSDAGYPLGEHAVVGPVRAWAHEERLHIPLLLRLPATLVLRLPSTPPRRIEALTQAVDLAPTVAALFGIEVPGAHGHDLLPLVRGEAASVRDYACCGVEAAGAVEWCLRTKELALLLSVQTAAEDSQRGPQWYVKPDDAWEVNNVVQHHLEQAEALEKTLRDFVAASRQAGPLVPPPLPEPLT